jgi:hypothetical protein
MSHLDNLGHLGFGERNIRGHPDGRIAAGRGDNAVAAHDGCYGVSETLPFFSFGSRKDLMAEWTGGPHR